MSFTVYRSSAGSGKTYTLVKEYLKVVLVTPNKFRHILAITFTNKAANEMKQRIINSLKEISEYDIFAQSNSVKYMLPELVNETGSDKESIVSNAQKALELILHQYSDFAISTIDSFIHRVIRSFAFDLQLPLNFEVEIDADDLITKVVDILLSKVGTDEKLTQILLKFTQSKTNEEKSWHIENDLTGIAKVLLKEDGQLHIEKLKNLSPDEFIKINKQVVSAINKFEQDIINIASDADKLIKSRNISMQAFFRGSTGIAIYFENLMKRRFDKLKPNNYVLSTIEEDKWYSGKATALDKAAINEIKDEIVRIFHSISRHVGDHHPDYIILKEILKNLYPVAVLNEIDKIMKDYKSDNNIVLISEFNKRISDIVLNEPVPFIYERLGEKYKHFLIDEFQDTSILQWQNLLPLVDNSLSEGNFNMIVGDGKQAIYRWRNGEVEQFAMLPKITKIGEHPYNSEREKSLIRNYNPRVLENNYRSKMEIVEFNNDFFSELSQILPEDYKLIYKDLIQKYDPENTGGLVHVEFQDQEDTLSFEEFNLLRIRETINELLHDSYKLEDIAILCRSNSSASIIAGYLLENNVNVVSSESLLLNSSSEIKFLIALVKVLINPNDKIAKTEVVNFLIDRNILKGQLHENLDKFGIVKKRGEQHEEDESFFSTLKTIGFSFSRVNLLNLQLYDFFEELIRIFGLNKKANPYVQFFLDTVLNFTVKNSSDIQDFLIWWEEKQDKLSIVVPEEINAVRVMTIHKSKGLEFPVVIYPFASEKHKITNDKLWIEYNNNEIPLLKSALINANKLLLETNFKEQYIEEDQKSLLDLINLIYVVMTRPTDRLIIFSSYPPLKKDAAESVPKFLRYYLEAKGLWQDNKNSYYFGKGKPKTQETPKRVLDFNIEQLISNPWKNRMLLSMQAPEHWEVENPDTNREWGNLIHLILSKIKTAADVDDVINKMINNGDLSGGEALEISTMIKAFLSNENVNKYFEKGLKIKTETEILTRDGKTCRPDRIVFQNDSVTVIDFKTGKPESKHKDQVRYYIEIVKQLGYNNVKGVLLYPDETEPVMEVA